MPTTLKPLMRLSDLAESVYMLKVSILELRDGD